MKTKIVLKPVSEQTIVITGASSGIGLTTARLAARRGARLVLAARSGDALRQLVGEIEAAGGVASAFVADVSKPDEVEALAAHAIATFGGFDCWINNAGTGLYGRLDSVPIGEMRALFETNFWGLVHGSRAAVAHLRLKGGALINLGSEVSDRAVPLQGIYSASKHAVKGFTDALRMELADEGAPVSVSLIKPGQIDTPFTVNAKNHLESEPHHVPPVYAPDAVARAILHAAGHPVGEVFVGGGGRVVAALGRVAPGLTDRLMQAVVIPGTPSGRTPSRPRDASGLETGAEQLLERGNYEGVVQAFSVYTEARLHPAIAGGIAAGLAYVLVRLFGGDGSHRPLRIEGRRGGRGAEKALRIRLEARKGREAEVEQLIQGILGHVEQEPATRTWFGMKLSRRVFEIVETFPNEAGRRAHLSGAGAALLTGKSNALLVRPAAVSKLDVIAAKDGGDR